MKNIYFLITIIRRSDAEEYERFFGERGAGVIYALNCNGTVHKRALDLLGIERSEKTMLITVTDGESLKRFTRGLTAEMHIDLPDRGVAMAVPLASIGGAHTLEYLTGEQIDQEKETENMHSDHELIVAIYERGFTDMGMVESSLGSQKSTRLRKSSSAYLLPRKRRWSL